MVHGYTARERVKATHGGERTDRTSTTTGDDGTDGRRIAADPSLADTAGPGGGRSLADLTLASNAPDGDRRHLRDRRSRRRNHRRAGRADDCGRGRPTATRRAGSDECLYQPPT